jgi:hypothetical protein
MTGRVPRASCRWSSWPGSSCVLADNRDRVCDIVLEAVRPSVPVEL